MTDNEIKNKMKEITYGWVDVNGNKHEDVDASYATLYRLQGPESLLTSKYGVCWDQVELERYYFSLSNYEFKTYIIVYFKDDTYPSHTFLIYKKENKYCWIENAYQKYIGIHEYSSLNEALTDVKEKFILDLKAPFDPDYLRIYEYEKPNYDITPDEFYKETTQNMLSI